MTCLPSADWRPRKAGRVVPVPTQRLEKQESRRWKSQSKSEGLRIRSMDVQGWEKMDV